MPAQSGAHTHVPLPVGTVVLLPVVALHTRCEPLQSASTRQVHADRSGASPSATLHGSVVGGLAEAELLLMQAASGITSPLPLRHTTVRLCVSAVGWQVELEPLVGVGLAAVLVAGAALHGPQGPTSHVDRARGQGKVLQARDCCGGGCAHSDAGPGAMTPPTPGTMHVATPAVDTPLPQVREHADQDPVTCQYGTAAHGAPVQDIHVGGRGEPAALSHTLAGTTAEKGWKADHAVTH